MKTCKSGLYRKKNFFTIFLLFLIGGVFLITYLFISNNSIEEGYLAYLSNTTQINRKYEKSLKVAIIIVTENKDQFDNYKLALTSLECYAIGRGYLFKILDFNENKNLSILCPQEDFFFARHCAIGKYLENHEGYIDYGVVLDGDIGVINPNNFLESYLPKSDAENIIVTQRLFTHEIAASPYIVKNNIEGRKFLYEWAEYFYRTPSNFHGADNGALMQLFMHKFGNHSYTKDMNRCYDLYENLSEWTRFRSYTICVMAILYEISMTKDINDDLIFENGSIKILRRFPFRSFVRDIWETNSKICSKDFFVHGLKQKNMGKKVPFGHWENPLTVDNFYLKKCSFSNFTKLWQYKKRFVVPSSDVYLKLLSVKVRTEEEHRNSMYSKIFKFKNDPVIDNKIYIASVFESEKDETKIILFTISNDSSRKIPFDNVQKLETYRLEDQLKLSYNSYQGKVIDGQSSENILSYYMSDKAYHKKFISIPKDKNIDGFSVCTPVLFNFPNLGKIMHFFKYWKSQGASYFIVYYHSWTKKIDDFVNDMKTSLNIEVVSWSSLPFNARKSNYANPNFQVNYHFQRLAELDCIYRSKNKVQFVIQPQLTEEINIENVNIFFTQMTEEFPDASGFRFPIYSKVVTNINDLLKQEVLDLLDINDISFTIYNLAFNDLDNIKDYIININNNQNFAYQIGYQNISMKGKQNIIYTDWVVPLRHWNREKWIVSNNSWLVI